MRIHRLGLLAALSVTALCGCASPPLRQAVSASAPVPYSVERVQHDLALGDGVRTIRIVNPHGSVGIRNSQQRILGMRAVIQRIGARPEVETITFETRGDTAWLEISYPSDREHGVDAMLEGHRKGRVDLAVFVPPQMLVNVQSTYGKIDVRRIDNDVVARTREGALVAAATGFLQLTTDSGDLRAWPMRGKASGPFVLTTRSGSIVTDVPLYGELSLRVRTRGRIDSEFAVDRTQGAGFNVATKFVASGAQHFDVHSQTGNVYLQGATRPPTPQ